MDPDSRDDVAREILLAEYKALRDEIIKKMDHRATFRISALTLTVAAIAAGVQFRNNMLLLLVPIVAVLFSNVAVYYSIQIGRAADYIRDRIEPKLDAQAPGSIGWHRWTGDRPAMFNRTLVPHYLSFMLTVLLPSVLAILLAWEFSGPIAISVGLTVIDVLLLGVFLWNFQHNRLVL